MRLDALLNLGALTHAVTQIIQLGAAHLTLADDLDLVHSGSVDGEHLLHTNAVGHAANSDGLLDAAVLLGDHGALKDLDTLAVAFLDVHVHTDGVAHIGHGGLSLLILGAESLHKIHLIFLLLIGVLTGHIPAVLPWTDRKSVV